MFGSLVGGISDSPQLTTLKGSFEHANEFTVKGKPQTY